MLNRFMRGAFLGFFVLGTALQAAESDSGVIKGSIVSFDAKAKVKLLTIEVENSKDKTKPHQDPEKPTQQQQDQKPAVKPGKPDQSQQPDQVTKKPGKPDQKDDKPVIKNQSELVVFIVDSSTQIVTQGDKGESTASYDALQPGKLVVVEYGQASLLIDTKPSPDKPNQDKPNQDKPNQDKPNQDKPNDRDPDQDADQKRKPEVTDPVKPSGDSATDQAGQVDPVGGKGLPPKKGKPGGSATYRAQKITLIAATKPGKPQQDQKPTQDDKPQKQKKQKPQQDQKPRQDQKPQDQKPAAN